MKKFVIGAEFMSGLANSTGKPFGFGVVGIGKEVEQVSKSNFQSFGGGFAIANKGTPYTYDASEQVIKAIVALNPPCWMDVEFAPTGFADQLEIVGVKALPASMKAVA